MRVEDLVAGDVVLLGRGDGSLREVKLMAGFNGTFLVGRVRHRDGWTFHGRVFPVRAGVLVRRLRWECPLSARQLDILDVFASGEVSTAKEVAARLGVDTKTVQNQLYTASKVLGTSGITQSLVVALQQGWVSLPVVEVDEAA